MGEGPCWAAPSPQFKTGEVTDAGSLRGPPWRGLGRWDGGGGPGAPGRASVGTFSQLHTRAPLRLWIVLQLKVLVFSFLF